ncbi:hypothetical protein Unana1_08745 [Umbelopsis nana]
MYLYKISVQTEDRSGASADLISKLLHNWRTHNKNNLTYRATLAKVMLLCLPGTYMLSTISELNEMLKYCNGGLKRQRNIADIVTKTGYTSLAEIEKLCKLLKFSNSTGSQNVLYDLTIDDEGNYILSSKLASFIIGSRTSEVHQIAIKSSSTLAKLDRSVFLAILTQSRDNDLNSDGASYASRNSEGTISIHFPVTAETCMSMGYNFYADKQAVITWGVYYERADGRFRIVKVDGDHIIDTDCVKLQSVMLIKPAFKLS